MPGCRPLRWIALSLSALLPVVGCVASTDSPQGETGSLSVDLVLADGIELDEVGWQITGNDMDMSGNIDVSAPRSTASVEVFGLPPGGGYTVTLTATSTDEEVTCEGSAPFSVEVGQSTDVMVMLNCKKPRTLGGVRVNGKFNICTQLTKVVVSPLQTSVGNDISLSAQAFDEEGDEIQYIWTGTGGSIADPSAASTTYTCQDVGEHTVMIMVTDNDVYCRMATWTVPVTCVEGDGGDLCEDVMCEDDGNECTETACNPADGACETNNVADGTECDGGEGTCSGGQCVEVDQCEGVDCDDNNECTADACDPADGTCSSTNVDDGTPCNNDEGVCSNGSCVDVNLCEGVVCDDTGNECTVAMCNNSTGECDTMNVADGTECNGGSGACSAGECVDNNLCDGVDCTSSNECVQDGSCDPADGQCIAGDNEAPDTACSDGGSVCDGLGACVECNASDQCPDASECQVPICVANTCAQNNVMDGQVCDFGGSDGICEAGTCVEAPQCISPGDCTDGNPCTIGLCTEGMCSFDPVAGGSCDPGTGSGDGTCSNTGTCVSNDECQANTDCSDDDGNECTVPVCDQTGVPYVCDEDPAPADGNACDGGSGTCQDGVCEVANPVISAGSGDTGWRALPRNCQTGWFENIDGPDPDSPNYPTDARVGCKLCLEGSCTGGTLDGRACSVDGDCPGGTCTVGSTPDPPDCELDCFAFTCEILTEPEFNLPTGGQAVYPTGGGRVANAAVRGCEVVSGTLKNQLAIDTNVFLNADSDGLGNLTVTYDVIAANAGLALAAPLANLNDVTVDTLLSSATPSSIQSKLDPALSGSSVGNFIAPVGGGQTGFVLSPDDVPPVTEAVTPTSFPNVLVNFDPAAILIELVIVSSGAPLDITGGSCTFNNPAGTCIGGLNAFDACDPSDPGGGPGGADCTASNPITPPGTCEATGGGPISLGSTP